MDNNTPVLVVNRAIGSLSYDLPELRISRHFEPRESKEITFNELHSLYQTTGGRVLIEDCLAIKDEEVIKALNMVVEPEYFYTEEEVKRVMLEGNLNEFLDLLDFAPRGVLEIVKNLAVSMPLNDVEKRNAILEKLSFNVTKAIEIQNTKFDGGEEDTSVLGNIKSRRVVSTTTPGANTSENKSIAAIRRAISQ